jgi:hypothetical protein
MPLTDLPALPKNVKKAKIVKIAKFLYLAALTALTALAILGDCLSGTSRPAEGGPALLPFAGRADRLIL